MNRTYRDVLDVAARPYVLDELDLFPRIAARLERKPFVQTLRARPVVFTLVVLVLLSLLGGVAYAIGRSLGYVPGVGLVEEGGGIRVLAEPVSAKRDGLTVTVGQVVADAKHTFVEYQIDGIPTGSSQFPMCHRRPVLELPDGSELKFLSGGGGGMESGTGFPPAKFETSYTFPSLPEGTEKISIVFPCILPENDETTEEWKIPLALVPAPAGYVTPAAEIEATSVSSGPKFATTPTPIFEMSVPGEPDPSFPATPTPVPNGSGLYLDKAIELADSYILVGNFTDAGDLPGVLETSTSIVYFYRPFIEDVNGKLVRFQPRTDIRPSINWSRVNYWAYEIPKSVQGPVKITIDRVNIDKNSLARFQFDTGPTPRPHQEWSLDLPLQLGEYEFVIDSVKMLEDGYSFTFHSGPDVPEGVSFSFDIIDSSSNRGDASAQVIRSGNKVKYIENVAYLAPLPTGQLTVELMLFQTVPLHGPWVLVWTPPNQNP
jgi:hypothetical protein